MLSETVAHLREEARRSNERRLLVLAGDHEAGLRAAERAIDAADVDRRGVTAIADEDVTHVETLAPTDADVLLGTTRQVVIVDCHDECRPNVLGRVVGAVDGGGLLVLVTPPLEEWADRRDGFDASLAVPPFTVEAVGGHFRERLVTTLRAHRGVAIYDVDRETVVDDGLTDPAPASDRARWLDAPPDHRFPDAAYGACLTQDQADAVGAFEHLLEAPSAVVVEADRGRGKSTAAGFAAAGLAAEGDDVLVTAPAYRNAATLFARAADLLRDLGAIAGDPGDRPRAIETRGGGRIRFARPPDAGELPGEPDVVLVDEAAGVPVRLLEALLDCQRVGFTTTVHGYEGAGRGFDVRFRDRLADREHAVHEVTMREPIRYAAGDPVEVWAFRALLLDASPAVDQLVADAGPPDAEYRALSPGDLLADEHLLREAFGLLVAAHYRTEPNDLARLLDAPNLSVRALLVDGHVVSVALLAREGNLDAATRAAVYEGSRIKGNMLPDVLMSQLRDESAGAPVGIRVVRVATHPAARSRGFGSRLLGEVREEFDDVDWVGTGFGATPRLVRFWAENGYGAVHLSTTRNDRSGEYSAIMLAPVSEAGRRLRDRHAAWFARRVVDQLPDVLTDVDPDVVRAVLRACPAAPDLQLSTADWRHVVGAAAGPGLYSVDPGPFKRLAVRHLVAGDPDRLDAREERLLVLKLLQARGWQTVADALDFHGTSAAMRALGDAFVPLVDAWAPASVREERERYR
ncbi:MAG: tRNA(Met) cytidine acetyltransferase TmcA [Halanaeroarchaeum sp.]